MIARSFWGARAAKGATVKGNESTEAASEPKADDLTGARIDETGPNSEPGVKKAASAELPPAPTVDELDLAVQKLSEGLEAIEQQGRDYRQRMQAETEAKAKAAQEPEGESHGAGENVASSLDRLEARLEALSRRLQQRNTGAAASSASAPKRERPSVESAIDPYDDPGSLLAESRRLAEAEEARAAERRRSIEMAEREAAEIAAREREAADESAAEDLRRQEVIAGARRHAEMLENQRLEELAEARRQAEAAEARRREAEARIAAEREAELEDARRRADELEERRIAETTAARRAAEEAKRVAEEAERSRQAEVAAARREAEEAEVRRRAEVTAVEERMRRHVEQMEAERRRAAEEAEAVRLADLAEARRQAEAAEARRLKEAEAIRRDAEAAAARRQAEIAAVVERQLLGIEARIDALQAGLDENQVEPVRGELLELVEEMAALSRGGRATSSSLDAIGSRLDEMESKISAARNMAGSRLGDIQDRLSGMVERLDQIEIEVPGFDAVRENQGAILERFDRMEGLVNSLASHDEIFERIDALKRQVQQGPSQQEVARIEEQILTLAGRIDALPADLSDEEALEKIESQLGLLATEFGDARKHQRSTAVQIDQHLSEISAELRNVAETGRTPDLSGIEQRIELLNEHLAEERRTVAETLIRLESSLEHVATAIEAQENDATAELIAGLTEKMDEIGSAIAAQDAAGARRDIGGLDRKLDELGERLTAQAEHLSRRQAEPLEARFDDMQKRLEEITQRSQDQSASFRPLAQKLQEISDRVTMLGAEGARSPLSERLAAMEDQLAALAGKGPDPRSLQTQLDAIASRLETLKGRSIDPARLNDLFDRIEVAIRAIPVDTLERLEERYDKSALPTERFDRLEQRLAATASADVTADRLAKLEHKIDEIGSVVLSAGDILTQEDLSALRADIVAMRREFRAIPGVGESDPAIAELLRNISRRLDRPKEAVNAFAGLEAHLERVALALQEQAQTPSGLADIHSALKTIETRLEDIRNGHRPSPETGDGEALAIAVDAITGDDSGGPLSDEIASLKISAGAVEAKAADAIEAVQDTLEAVVKRMAFLERDAEEASDEAAIELPELPELPRLPKLPVAEGPRVGAAPDEDETESGPEAHAEAHSEPSEGQSGGGLFGRLTSRQLLRRATGGRAESFTPEPEEVEDTSDLPLEPGTDSPLTSALTDAPSSDTERMSGGRRRRAAARVDATGRAGRVDEPGDDDDFLAAARRAARAASAEDEAEEDEVEETEETSGGSTGRWLLLAASLLIVAGLGAAAALRPDLLDTERVIAFFIGEGADTPPAIAERAPEAPATREELTATAPQSMPPEPVVSEPADSERTASGAASSAASEPAAPAPESAEPAATAMAGSAMPTEDMRPEEPLGKPAEATAAMESSEEPAASTSAGDMADVVSEPPADTMETASVAPTTPDETSAAMSPAETGAAPAGTPELGSLPESIGPESLRTAALGGDRIAAFEVAARYAEGRGVVPDMKTAVLWYERSAALGLAPAQYRLGSIYEKGLGVSRDLSRAQDWYRQAADAGNVKAMHNLAVLYAEGAGGEPDLEKAAVLFRQAAEHGVRDSQFNLAILNARGLGVPQNLVDAYKWFAVAATSGDEESAKRRDIIAQALSEQDLAKARAAAASFQPQPLVAGANEVLMPDSGWIGDNSSVEVKSDNEMVALVQKLLAENGYDPGPADGLLGTKTIEAISEFQGRAGLPRTGEIDTDLVAALRNRST